MDEELQKAIDSIVEAAKEVPLSYGLPLSNPIYKTRSDYDVINGKQVATIGWEKISDDDDLKDDEQVCHELPPNMKLRRFNCYESKTGMDYYMYMGKIIKIARVDMVFVSGDK